MAAPLVIGSECSNAKPHPEPYFQVGHLLRPAIKLVTVVCALDVDLNLDHGNERIADAQGNVNVKTTLPACAPFVHYLGKGDGEVISTCREQSHVKVCARSSNNRNELKMLWLLQSCPFCNLHGA